MTSMSIIGMGNVGKTLGFLFARAGVAIESVHSRSERSARDGLAFIRQGSLARRLEEVAPADFLLIATNDAALSGIGADTLTACRLRPGSIAFHCSGATSSELLGPLRGAGLHVGSVHPVFSFAAPERDVRRFGGTWCGVEGDELALPHLDDLFKSIGGHPFRVDRERKSLYHASLVIACNYLVGLMDVAMRVCQAAGVEEASLGAILGPFVRGTLDNVLQLGPAAALTGPIARGDHAVVARQLVALQGVGREEEALYRLLGQVTVGLSARKGAASPADLARLREILTGAEATPRFEPD
jgi:predicted short-subunit dehydrogenase-like oxidoreductase (DUF2520 family)